MVAVQDDRFRITQLFQRVYDITTFQSDSI